MSKWYGITADDMNYMSRNGFASESDLKDWANLQNKLVVSIEWHVGYYTRPMPTITDQEGYIKTYYLYSRKPL